ncbi:MAG: NADH-quinone oxidoreductase subunit L [Chitinophagaceae bacterium]|jgi:NADH-quinone oxidoreductase subunit L|nr:NADH-quinone oxidoreductase subunit L [Chitinophagaceae bacterium]
MKTIIGLIVLWPLAGFLLNGLGRNIWSKKTIATQATGYIFASFVFSLIAFWNVQEQGAITVHYFDFINTSTVKIPFDFRVDALSSLFLLVITGVGTLIHLYSSAYMHEETAPHYARYFAYLNLFIFSMLLLVLGDNYVIMFIGWEGVGLCSYLLIGYWFTNTTYNNAAKKAFIMNRIGDLGFLLAIFWLIVKLGTVSYGEVLTAESLAKLSSTDITAITLLLFVGAMGKSAQIPLYTWLPDAMAGPTPVSALIHAATMVTAGIYMITRTNIFYTHSEIAQTVVAIIGISTALLAATIAIKQNDIKKVLAYSTVSQLGYMFLGLGVGAYSGAVFHVITHAFFKALLFLAAGSVIHAMHHEQDIRKMGGLKSKLPITHLTFLIGCIAIAGVPPFSGFFSKDEILAAAYAKNPIYWFLGLVGAAMTAFYMFRLYATTFLGQFRGTEAQASHLHESPISMTLPLIILAVLSAVGGAMGVPEILGGHHWLSHHLSSIIGAEHALHLSHTTEWILMGSSVTIALVALLIAIGKYSKQADGEPQTALGKFLYNKWLVDELYEKAIVQPLHRFAGFLKEVVEKNVIDGLVNGTGKLVQYGARQTRLMQSGQVGYYILFMVLSIVLLFLIWFNDLAITRFLHNLIQ